MWPTHLILQDFYIVRISQFLEGDCKKGELEDQTPNPELQLKWGIRNTEIEIGVYSAGKPRF